MTVEIIRFTDACTAQITVRFTGCGLTLLPQVHPRDECANPKVRTVEKTYATSAQAPWGSIHRVIVISKCPANFDTNTILWRTS